MPFLAYRLERGKFGVFRGLKTPFFDDFWGKNLENGHFLGWKGQKKALFRVFRVLGGLKGQKRHFFETFHDKTRLFLVFGRVGS